MYIAKHSRVVGHYPNNPYLPDPTPRIDKVGFLRDSHSSLEKKLKYFLLIILKNSKFYIRTYVRSKNAFIKER